MSSQPPDRILITRFKSIGDILFTLPATHAVRENFPDAKISFMISKEHAPLLEGFRDVNEVIPVDRAVYRGTNPLRAIAKTLSLLRSLRRAKFSLAIDLQGYGETALLTRFTGAKERWGMVYQKGRRWAYTRGCNREGHLHQAEWNLWMLEQCGLKIGVVRNEFVLPDHALKEARAFFDAQQLSSAKRTLFVQPFTSAPHKNWPLQKYLDVAAHWKKQDVQVLFSGGPGDRAALEPVRAAGFVVSAGTSLLVTGGLMKLSTLVLGGDTGMLHMAVAMDKRIAMIVNNVAAERTGPFRHVEWTIRPEQGKRLAEIETSVVNAFCANAFAEQS